AGRRAVLAVAPRRRPAVAGPRHLRLDRGPAGDAGGRASLSPRRTLSDPGLSCLGEGPFTHSEAQVKQPFHLTRSRARTTTVPGSSAAAAVALTVPGLALAHGGHGHGGGAVPPPPANPTSDSQIQNLDQVETAIKAYYGDTVTTVKDPINGTTFLHQFAAN